MHPLASRALFLAAIAPAPIERVCAQTADPVLSSQAKPEPKFPAFGGVLARLDDVDGDGRTDVLVGDPGMRTGDGRVFVVSLGATRKTLLSMSLYRDAAESGLSLCALGGQGAAQEWVAVAGFDNHAKTARALAFTGVDATPKLILDSSRDDQVLLGPCGSAGDIDKDGRDDAWFSVLNKKTGRYALIVRSLATNRTLATLGYDNGIDENTPKLVANGGCIVYSNWEIENAFVRDAAFADFDGDGVVECLLARWPSYAEAWHLRMVSLDGATKRERSWPDARSYGLSLGRSAGAALRDKRCLAARFGGHVELLAEADLSTLAQLEVGGYGSTVRIELLRDREHESWILAAPNPAGSNDAGEVSLYSLAAKPTLIRRVQPDASMWKFGSAVLNVGDLTGEGVDDLAVSGAPTIDPVRNSGRVILISGSTGNRIAQIVRTGDGLGFE